MSKEDDSKTIDILKTMCLFTGIDAKLEGNQATFVASTQTAFLDIKKVLESGLTGHPFEFSIDYAGDGQSPVSAPVITAIRLKVQADPLPDTPSTKRSKEKPKTIPDLAKLAYFYGMPCQYDEESISISLTNPTKCDDFIYHLNLHQIPFTVNMLTLDSDPQPVKTVNVLAASLVNDSAKVKQAVEQISKFADMMGYEFIQNTTACCLNIRGTGTVLEESMERFLTNNNIKFRRFHGAYSGIRIQKADLTSSFLSGFTINAEQSSAPAATQKSTSINPLSTNVRAIYDFATAMEIKVNITQNGNLLIHKPARDEKSFDKCYHYRLFRAYLQAYPNIAWFDDIANTIFVTLDGPLNRPNIMEFSYIDSKIEIRIPKDFRSVSDKFEQILTRKGIDCGCTYISQTVIFTIKRHG